MSAKNHIDTIVADVTKSYAYAYLQKDRSSMYGHMIVEIRLARSAGCPYRRLDGSIKISCQIGTDGDHEDMFFKPYAQRYGFDARHGDGSLEELEIAVKVMRKIVKHMDKEYQTYGEPKTYADYCQRILVGAGVKNLIVEPNHWCGGGRNLSDMEMVLVGATSAYKLDQMEKELITSFVARRRAA